MMGMQNAGRRFGLPKISLPFGRRTNDDAVFSEDGALERPAPRPKKAPPPPPEDTGLYGVLGVDPSASDAEIQVVYRRRAAQIANSSFGDARKMRDLNAAYEVLGNPSRRADYDRRRREVATDADPDALVPRAAPPTFPRMRHPQRSRAPADAGLSDFLGIVLVVLLAVVAGWFVLGRVNVDLPDVESIPGLSSFGGPARGSGVTGGTPVPGAPPQSLNGPIPTPSVSAALREQLRGSSVTVTDPRPRPRTIQNVVVKVVRNGQPAPNVETWVWLYYRTVRERFPNSGTLRTDLNGLATFTFNIGDATPGFEVRVDGFALVDGQEVSWGSSFTPQ